MVIIIVKNGYNQLRKKKKIYKKTLKIRKILFCASILQQITLILIENIDINTDYYNIKIKIKGKISLKICRKKKYIYIYLILNNQIPNHFL